MLFVMRQIPIVLCMPSVHAYRTQLKPTLQHYVLPCFDVPAGHERAKACRVTQQYAYVKFAGARGPQSYLYILRRELLCVQAPYKTQLEPMLQQYVLPCFDAPAGHVRAKACWVTQQYADVKFADGRGRGATFMQLFQKTLERLNDPDLPVSPASSAKSALSARVSAVSGPFPSFMPEPSLSEA